MINWLAVIELLLIVAWMGLAVLYFTKGDYVVGSIFAASWVGGIIVYIVDYYRHG